MKLDKKKNLAARALGVGKNRIIFVKSRLEEIKEAITKQDIKYLHKEGAIVVREVKGRKRIIKRKKRTGFGKVKKKVNKRKQDYVTITRKLRRYIKGLKQKREISKEDFADIRKKIKNKKFESLSSLKAYIKATGGISI